MNKSVLGLAAALVLAGEACAIPVYYEFEGMVDEARVFSGDPPVDMLGAGAAVFYVIMVDIELPGRRTGMTGTTVFDRDISLPGGIGKSTFHAEHLFGSAITSVPLHGLIESNVGADVRDTKSGAMSLEFELESLLYIRIPDRRIGNFEIGDAGTFSDTWDFVDAAGVRHAGDVAGTLTLTAIAMEESPISVPEPNSLSLLALSLLGLLRRNLGC